MVILVKSVDDEEVEDDYDDDDDYAGADDDECYSDREEAKLKTKVELEGGRGVQ